MRTSGKNRASHQRDLWETLLANATGMSTLTDREFELDFRAEEDEVEDDMDADLEDEEEIPEEIAEDI